MKVFIVTYHDGYDGVEILGVHTSRAGAETTIRARMDAGKQRSSHDIIERELVQ